MIGKTLYFYLTRNFLRNVGLVFLLFLTLVIAIDLLELSRDLASAPDVTFLDIATIAVSRAPVFAGDVLPFATLFGATATLLLLNRRLELVVARASGVSAWQFLMPVLVAAALLGLFASMIYNPLALQGKAYSAGVEATVFGKVKGAFSNKTEKFWQRLPSRTGDTVIKAEVVEDAGAKLSGVTAFRFDEAGVTTERYDAGSAIFVEQADGQNVYVLKDARISRPGESVISSNDISIPVQLSREQLQARVQRPVDVGYWQLAETARRAEDAGKNGLPFSTQLNALNAQPITFAAMVLIAGTMSLGFARFGIDWGAIATGLGCGFMLYVVLKLVLTFGSNGLVPPWVAAWSPGLVASLIGMTVILNREDG